MLFGKKKSSQRQNPIVVFKPGNEVITESFNRLKDNIVFQNVDNTIKVIQISSSTACEGKTTVISNLAVSLATNGNKVLLVDGDLRAPRLHHPFNLGNDFGLRDYVIGSKSFTEIIQKTSYNVDVIWHMPPPIPSTTFPPEYTAAFLNPASAVLFPTILL